LALGVLGIDIAVDAIDRLTDDTDLVDWEAKCIDGSDG
jgi:hypothetical protein